jgi:hypothetical protein
MLQGEVRQRSASGERMALDERVEAKGWGDRKYQFRKQVFAHGGEFIGFATDCSIPHDLGRHHVDQVSEPGYMVQVRMTQEDVEVFRSQVIAESGHPRAGIQHDTDGR